MKNKELLPELTPAQVENLISFMGANYYDQIDGDEDYCCTSEALEAGSSIAAKAIRKGYGLIPEIDPEKDGEDDE